MTWACPALAFALLLELGAADAPAHAGSAPVPDPAAAAEAIAAGDAHYARRGEGADGQRALPFEIEGAIAQYRRALALDPASYEARVSLMRAYFFRGGFCGEMPRDDKERIFDEAKRIGEETVARLDPELKRKRGSVSREAAARIGPAARAYLWAAISWGQWTVFHRMSAVWSGAPGRIRDLAEAVLAVDPATEQAGAYILLGRLHGEAPRVPFVTGWVSREKAVRYVLEGRALARCSSDAPRARPVPTSWPRTCTTRGWLASGWPDYVELSYPPESAVSASAPGEVSSSRWSR